MAKTNDIENPYIPEFEKYLRTPEPSVRERADYWRTAIDNILGISATRSCALIIRM